MVIKQSQGQHITYNKLGTCLTWPDTICFPLFDSATGTEEAPDQMKALISPCFDHRIFVCMTQNMLVIANAT